MKKLYIHIGTEKTGTTTVQEFLFKNREVLKGEGVLYPNILNLSNHVGFCLAFMDFNPNSELYSVVGCEPNENSAKEFSGSILEKLAREIVSSDCDTVIISNEHLHSRITTQEEIFKIKEWASKFFDEIEIVCYLRNQADLAVSYYSTLIKSGNVPERVFPNFSSVPHYYDYKKLLDGWSAAFGKITVKSFSRSLLKNENIIDDFIDVACLCGAENKFFQIEDSNVSLDAYSLEILKSINESFPFVKEGKINPERRYLVPFFEKSSGNCKFVPDELEYYDFLKRFSADNEYIAEKYKINFSPMISRKRTPRSLSPEIWVEKFSSIWSQSINHINFLEARNQALMAEIAFLNGDLGKAKKFIDESENFGFRLKMINDIKAKIDLNSDK
ncbi:hypothetical protein ACJJIL_17525 [Microbulbifer sp. EKSA005]|uniref:hypothetical protein n=1 Tax=Microbulbifer sp. EKSA005 TaxID=3243364 RepID=UPI004043532A